MMKVTPIAYVLVVSGFLLLQAASASLEVNCKKIADETVTYQFCMTSLGADPKSKTADLPALGAIASKLSLAKGTQVQSYINKLLQGSTGDQMALKDCKAMFEEALPDEVEAAIEGFESEDYASANVHMSAILTNSDDCETEFGETADPHFLNMNHIFQNLTSIALSISTKLGGLTPMVA